MERFLRYNVNRINTESKGRKTIFVSRFFVINEGRSRKKIEISTFYTNIKLKKIISNVFKICLVHNKCSCTFFRRFLHVCICYIYAICVGVVEGLLKFTSSFCYNNIFFSSVILEG